MMVDFREDPHRQGHPARAHAAKAVARHTLHRIVTAVHLCRGGQIDVVGVFVAFEGNP